MIADNIRIEPFWQTLPHQPDTRINGSQSHHCDICPLPQKDICTLPCQGERDKIKDGIVVRT
jgi:hypothetical protein